MPKQFLVTWEIDIEADGPHEAAVKALAIQRNPDSIATVFVVYDQLDQKWYTQDLGPEEE